MLFEEIIVKYSSRKLTKYLIILKSKMFLVEVKNVYKRHEIKLKT